MVWKLDRLGRRMKHLIALTEELRAKGVNFRSPDGFNRYQHSDGKVLFHMMGALAEMERELIVERTLAGLAAARAQKEELEDVAQETDEGAA